VKYSYFSREKSCCRENMVDVVVHATLADEDLRPAMVRSTPGDQLAAMLEPVPLGDLLDLGANEQTEPQRLQHVAVQSFIS